MEYKSTVMDAHGMSRSLARITHEILEKNKGADNIVLLGVKRRGVPLASVLCANIEKFDGKKVPLGSIDITMFRDDIAKKETGDKDGECLIPCELSDKNVILVDDVICTGRTVRAAIEAVFAHGRPRSIQLAVLVDRGHRELPIRPDFVGKNIPTAKSERILVKVDEIDGETGVFIYAV